MHYPATLQPHILHIAEHLGIRPDDISEHNTHGHGPGGQKKNKRSNCVELTHRPTGITVRIDNHRHLSQNRDQAWELLILKVEEQTIGAMEERERELYHEMKAASRRSKDGHELSGEAKQMQHELQALKEQERALGEE